MYFLPGDNLIDCPEVQYFQKNKTSFIDKFVFLSEPRLIKNMQEA